MFELSHRDCCTSVSDKNGTADEPRTRTKYTYDTLGRLATAVTTGSTQFAKWGISETYDRYGNRTNQTVTAGSAPANSLTFATTPAPPVNPPGGAYTNRPDGYLFDASGNMLNDGINTLTYDAENCLTSNTNSSTGTTNYTCDAAGVRVKKALQGGTTTVYIFDGDLDIAEYNSGAAPGSPSREFLYAGSDLVASITGSNTIYHHKDHLSVRLYTDGNGQVTAQQATYPYGESWYSTGAGAPDQFVFTTYQRDSESGNDYAMARYYISRFGRFCSADPLMGDPGDPQSWDRYAYVRNDPVNLTDPSGQSWVKWLVDALVGLTVALLPEIAPALLGQASLEASVATSMNGVLQTETLYYGGASTAAATGGFSAGSAIMAGAAGFGAAVTAQNARPTQPQANPPQQPQQQAKDNCPQVPQHPNGADVNANIRATQGAVANAAVAHAPHATAWNWFINQVKPGGPWDYKAQPPGFQAYDDFGNFNYGATGSILADEKTLDQGAALARFSVRPRAELQYGAPWKGPNYGNDAHKNAMIRQGIKYRKNNCGNS